MGLVWRLGWSFVHVELIVDQSSQGHNLQRNDCAHYVFQSV